ncbi:MAG: hypothetical protein ACE5E5_08660 [Phycisphaerae bacterium]
MRKSTTFLAVGLLGVGALVSLAQAEVVFRPASASPAQGFKAMNSVDGRYFVSGETVFTDANLAAVRSVRGGSMELAVNADLGGADRVAVFVDGEFVGAPKARATGGSLVLSELSRNTGAHVANVLGNTGAASDAPVISVQVSSNSVAPGGTVSADVYISNVTGLNTYQVRINATSASAGILPVTNLQIDKTRSDFVFAGGDVLDAVDSHQNRMGALLFNSDTVDSVGRLYLGSYTFQVPADATGAVYVGVEVGGETFLIRPDGKQMPYRVGAAAVVTTGARPNLGR